MRFEKYHLYQFEEPRTYKLDQKHNLDDVLFFLIDNIQNLSTDYHTMQKTKIIGALVQYFLTIRLKLSRKKFLCYVVYSPPKPDIYATWAEAKAKIALCSKPSWRGSHNLKEAMNDIQVKVNCNYYLSLSLSFYNVCWLLRKREAQKSGESPKEWVDIHNQVLEDINHQDVEMASRPKQEPNTFVVGPSTSFPSTNPPTSIPYVILISTSNTLNPNPSSTYMTYAQFKTKLEHEEANVKKKFNLQFKEFIILQEYLKKLHTK